MPYLFTLPNAMRAFISTGSSSKTLFRTSCMFHSGEVIKISEVAVMNYDNRNQLSLRLYQNNLFLLVEEIDEKIREVAFRWCRLFEKSSCVDAAIGLAALPDELVPLVPLIALDEEGFGIHMAL